ncbi:hypothetical protein BVRB_2g028730 [Beta vulgaris subsp. vulgaris]|nr:hypothetical protein BVRB_2g028730 [Beta vulgaris subsp. vulgaris]
MEAVSTYAIIPFLSGFFNVLIDRLAPENMRLSFVGLKTSTELKKLRNLMIDVNRVMIDAEMKQLTDADVKNWIDEVKNIRYDAEDLLDEIHTEELLREKKEQLTQGYNQYLGQVLSSIPAIIGRLGLGKDSAIDYRIQGINQRLKTASQQIHKLDLTRGLKPPPVSSALQPTSSSVDESRIYGRDSERDDIIQYLEDGVPLPDDLLKGKRIVNGDIRYYQKQLRERIRGNSILIVLDDVWDENMDISCSWETLKILLNSAATGSAIIVTTPNEQIAMSFHPSCILLLPCLSDEDCWTLFRLHAFGDPDASPGDKLEPICRELVAKCGGLPLAVKVLGSLLSLPSSIGSLKYLRYLDFSSTFIKELPESICELLNLQTLLLNNCKRLRILPAMMRNLIHLRHLNIHGTCIQEMPVDIGRLSCLQTLTDFVASDHPGSSIRELGELSQLRGSMRISGLLDFVAEADAFAANLRDKAHLDELVFELQGKCSLGPRQHEQIMHALKPHTNLARLTIDYFGGEKYPDWVGDEIFCNLEVLHLKYDKVCVELPSLGQLPVLKHLSIVKFNKLEALGAGFYGECSASSSPFKSLLTLKIEGLRNLKKWCTFEGNASPFPCLLELCVTYCRKLEGNLPLDLSSLVKLTLNCCEKLTAILPDAPLLRELFLFEIGSIDLTILPRCSHLTTFTFSMSEDRQVHEIICHLTSLRELRMLRKFLRNSNLQPLLLPASVRSLNVYFDKQIISDDASQLHYLCLKTISSPLQIQTGSFQLLHVLEFQSCYGLKEFPSALEGGDLDFTSLYDLRISDCKHLVSFPVGGFLAHNLTTLDLNDCCSLKSPPNNMPTNFPSLRFLSFSLCPELELSEDYGFPPHLQTLRISFCKKLRTLPEAISSSAYLKLLQIDGCHEFVGFPANGLPANLESLTIYDCDELAYLPDRLCSTVKHLDIRICEKLDSSPFGGLFPSLESMTILYCQKLCQKYADWQVGGLVSLKIMKIGGINDVESFPPDGFLPNTLNFLQLNRFKRLRSINCKELQRVINLCEFEILKCRELILLSDDLPQSLCRLSIQGCDKMKKRCLIPDGNYVDKISHITCLELID